MRFVRLVRDPPETTTSTPPSGAAAAAAPLAARVRGQRGGLAQLPEAGLHRPEVGVLVAADHEPRPRPVRDDVGGRAALLDDPVDPGRRAELVAPQSARGE